VHQDDDLFDRERFMGDLLRLTAMLEKLTQGDVADLEVY
jgi:hypothetical protein